MEASSHNQIAPASEETGAKRGCVVLVSAALRNQARAAAHATTSHIGWLPLPSIRGAWLRISSWFIVHRLSRSGVSVGRGVRFLGSPIVTPAEGSSISIGDRTVLISEGELTALGVNHPVVLRTLHSGARIDIGSDVGASGASICAAQMVVIGDECLLGANVTIVDTDFHPLEGRNRRYGASTGTSARRCCDHRSQRIHRSWCLYPFRNGDRR